MSPSISAEADVILIDVPDTYGASYSAFVHFLRHQLPGVWIDWTAAKEAFLWGRGRPFPIGRRRQEAAADEKAKVRFSDDGLTAYLVLYPPKPNGRRLTELELLRLIRAYGVPSQLLDTQQVRLAFLRRTYGEAECVARGVAAVNGEAAHIVWGQGFPSDTEGFLTALRNAENIYPQTILGKVSAGEIAGKLYRPGDGTPGLSVSGQVIAPRRGEDCTHLGAGLEIDDDGETIRSRLDGHLRISGSSGVGAQVIPLLVAKSVQDLEPWAGGLYPGSIVVEGDLEIRFPLRVLGDVEVRGGLVRSDLEVMGSLFVRDGVINHGRAPVRVGGLLTASFLDRASVMAETVHLRRYALQSRIVALRSIIALGSGVSIAGGVAHAALSVHAEILGSPNAMETEIAVAPPSLSASFQSLYQSWADALTASGHSENIAGDELRTASSRWTIATQTAPPPDLNNARILARKVCGGVAIRVGNSLREIGNACGPVTFSYERIGERDRVAMVRQ